jgi:hypothetical protein
MMNIYYRTNNYTLYSYWMFEWVSEWILFTTNWAMIQLYYDEKLDFDNEVHSVLD